MTAQRKTLRTAEELAAAGLVRPADAPLLDAVAARYAVAVSPAIAALIDPADPDDPIARQFLPDPAELDTAPEERLDPIGDDAMSPVEGVVHRYPDRVLLKLVHVCPVYCRFCFRRAMVGPGGRPTLSPKKIMAALDYIRGRREIFEVILTGGDPLILAPDKLAVVVQALGAIPHVKVVRVHTRVPVAVPETVTQALVDALKIPGKATYVVLHANHPRELTDDARKACDRLIDAGIPMLSQSVLLKGVNDDDKTLAELMRSFVAARIKPYYLHHGDLAPGTTHLRTTLADGQVLMRRLRGRVSGLAQPTYVLDLPGGAGKVPVGPTYATPVAGCEPGGPAHWEVEDLQGRSRVYPPGPDDAEPVPEDDGGTPGTEA
ncbi:lysine 2,3-aminomutase [Rhodoplanes elegans]|uniref:Lysine 2,3-aminomutase n=1 Tax=Rhodoplanes elegans TaxID=29408 RepID=A0A327KCN8_9BRAD|nr:lysine-2,3-aminomutase-like protein [Rhodoplanes elegans]MBK5961770.1 lysine 2,3-aminomutase [Rhodoplanes elegans]RAI33058.1 lysine 2,3-aminomutase [Rhodoplanes elegans]